MKCLLCTAEIDESRVINPRNEYDREMHARELEQWEQVTVTVARAGAVQLLNGHVCPAEKLAPGDVDITRSQK